MATKSQSGIWGLAAASALALLLMARAGGAATNEGFGAYLRRRGVRYFSVEEVVRPRHPDIAARLGYEDFTPPPAMWPRLARTLLVADRLREAAGEPISLYNAWRPADYNVEVGGKEFGDHPEGYAVDLAFRSREGWARAVQEALRLYADPAQDLSLGIGLPTTQRVIHLGVGSPRGRRRWRYDASGNDIRWHDGDLR